MEDLRDIILKYALQNAILHGGKANYKAVMGKIMAENPSLRSRAKELIEEVKKIVEEINSLSLEEQKKELEEIAPELLERKKKEERKELEDLPDVQGEVRMRLAPSPSGPMHLGQSRMAILNDEYVKRYGGVLFLRIEDTNPHNILPEAYDMIPEDLEWLGVKVHHIVIQSDRFEIYYDYAKKLLEMGKAYITTVPAEEWRKLKSEGKPTKDRELPPEEQLERWEKMLAGEYDEGEAVYVVKTDLQHPNPAIRDWAAFRIIKDVEHPRLGNKYIVYPLMNFSVAVDDHELQLTHVLRGKDHLNNTYRQMYLYDYFGWKKPVYIHYGWVTMKDTILKTSLIKEGIRKGEYMGWDDPRLGTLRALAKRGIQPEAIRKYWVQVGLKEVDIEFSWDTLYAYNRELVDSKAKRYFFVWNPKEVEIRGVEKIEGKAPLHPNIDMGFREYKLSSPIKILVTMDDWKGIENGEVFRLKDLCNVVKREEHLEYAGNDLSIVKRGAKIVHWVPEDSLPCKVYMPDGKSLEGYAEKYVENSINEIVQFERFGFTKIYKEGELVGYFAHR
ncbi:glutamyl-tRNA synthetase [Aciduliprofundum boonei T469]|uniref:Glutamate--tRNA ligase n=1 Tax=Aciduliprofundum boonei (strain DSM 19572 / T469) TaxID=439481 RepID=B5IEN1_ACIB4|nr:glutamyl-tRNA synthetase [Aciduliprofundum boonei T469]EDY35236.1 glutamyl-tRNA synthetase [Aciduliprofundum boonei T469]HII55008.1 glutamate--tRNA ligase [Candidatus Aciduliprofundum boonei]